MLLSLLLQPNMLMRCNASAQHIPDQCPFLLGGAPCSAHASSRLHSMAGHRRPAALQLKRGLPRLSFTLLCTSHIHCSSCGCDCDLGGFSLHKCCAVSGGCAQ